MLRSSFHLGTQGVSSSHPSSFFGAMIAAVGLLWFSPALAEEEAEQTTDGPDSETSDSAKGSEASSEAASSEAELDDDESPVSEESDDSNPESIESESESESESDSEMDEDESSEGDSLTEEEEQNATDSELLPTEEHSPDDTDEMLSSEDEASPSRSEPRTQDVGAEPPAEAEAPKSPLTQERQGFIFVPQAAFAIGGWTDIHVDCESRGSLSCDTEDMDGHAEASGLAFSLDGLYQVLPNLGFGVSGLWIPSVKGNAGTERRYLGMEFDVQALVEGVVDLGDSLALSGRLQLGGAFLVPRGAVTNEVLNAIDDCFDVVGSGVSCSVAQGPYAAFTYGVGAGLIWSVAPTRLRLDLRYQLQNIPILTQHASSDEGSLEAAVKLDQSRVWMLLGFEI